MSIADALKVVRGNIVAALQQTTGKVNHAEYDSLRSLGIDSIYAELFKSNHIKL